MSPWIVSPRYDLLLFNGSALAVFVAWYAHSLSVDAYWIIAAVAVMSNGPHLTATWTRAWLDARERTERPFAYLVVPAGILAAVFWIGSSGRWGNRLLMSILILWAIWHFAAQCYGILRIYQRKSGEPWRIGHRLESAFVFAVAATGLVWRLHYGPTRVGGYRVLLPDLPFEAVVASLALVGVLAAGIAWDRMQSQHAMGWPRLIFLSSIVVAFWVPFMFIEHGTVAFAAAACWHGFQYLGVVWMFSMRKHGGKPLVPGARLVGWVSQPGRGWAFMGLLWALAACVYGVVFVVATVLGQSVLWVAGLTWLGLTMGHYWLDGLIWKMRKPAVAAHLT